MRTWRLSLLTLIVGVICAGPAALGATQSSGTKARIVDFRFDPTELRVAANTTIEWTNNGARPHTVTDRGGTFDTGAVSPGLTGSITLTVPGHYYFFCRINPSKMNGVLVVEAGAAQPRVVRIEATDPARPGDALSFNPAEVSIPAGGAVVLANVGGKPHTLSADDGSFDTGIVTPGAEGGRFAGSNASITVSKPGTYPFHCNVHPDAMKGVLTVTGSARAGPAAPSEAARAATAKIVDFAFNPKETSVAAGGTVTWQNTGQAPHTATFDDVDLNTDTISPGSDAKLVAPARSGSYSYRCNIHPAKMRGVLVVVGQNARDPTKAQAIGNAQPTGAEVGGGITTLALVTGVAGAFMGGFAISAFVRNKMGQS
jgi:plastocyanin